MIEGNRRLRVRVRQMNTPFDPNFCIFSVAEHNEGHKQTGSKQIWSQVDH